MTTSKEPARVRAGPSLANFAFLGRYDDLLVRIAAVAERNFPDDPVTTLMKLRQFGEVLAQQVAARSGLLGAEPEDQAALLGRLWRDGGYDRRVIDLFHDLRRAGNEAVHQYRGDHTAALNALKIAWQLGIWFHRTFGGDRNFSSGPFQPPRPPADPSAQLREELDRLRVSLEVSQSEAERAREAVAASEQARLTAEQRAQQAAEERAFWERYAAETEAANTNLAATLATLQATAKAAPEATHRAFMQAAEHEIGRAHV